VVAGRVWGARGGGAWGEGVAAGAGASRPPSVRLEKGALNPTLSFVVVISLEIVSATQLQVALCSFRFGFAQVGIRVMSLIG
jgi:hypothetical protein